MKNSSKLLIASLCALLTACATDGWRVITSVQEIAATRAQVNKPSFDLKNILIVRLNKDGIPLEISSIAPAVIGAEKDGAPGARTVFTFSGDKSQLILFGQNVPKFLGFYQEIPVSQLKPGFTFRFPVVQENGEVKTESFTVERLIDNIPG